MVETENNRGSESWRALLFHYGVMLLWLEVWHIRAEDTERRLCVPGPFREPYRGRGQPFQPGRCERRYKEAKDDLFLWYFEILEKNEIKIYPKKMTYNQMMEECKKNDIYIIKPLYSLGYTYNNNREDFKNYN